MKTLHFYANLAFEPFDSEQPSLRPDSSLDGWMLHIIAQEVLVGKPPFKLTIPRDAAWKALGGDFPSALFDVEIIAGKTESTDPAVLCDPYDTARIECDTAELIIHYRRCHVSRPWVVYP